MYKYKWTKYQLDNLGKAPSELLVDFLDKYRVKKAIDLGCGSGNDSVYMLKKGIKVLCVDQQLEQTFITDRLTDKEKSQVTFLECSFEDISLPKTELITANFSIPFCLPTYFDRLWKEIYNSIVDNGYFVGQLFGDRDDWSIRKNISTFSKEEVLKLLESYNILKFEEVEYIRDSDNKKWHYFNIVAQKK